MGREVLVWISQGVLALRSLATGERRSSQVLSSVESSYPEQRAACDALQCPVPHQFRHSHC